jgi:hypothetical protein
MSFKGQSKYEISHFLCVDCIELSGRFFQKYHYLGYCSNDVNIVEDTIKKRRRQKEQETAAHLNQVIYNKDVRNLIAQHVWRDWPPKH